MSADHSLPLACEEIVAIFASAPSREQIAAFRLSDAAIQRTRDLLAKNSAGTLTESESEELDESVWLDQFMTLIRTRASC
jgi:hypothetical protein